MAELADALDLGSSGATRTGSIPATRTKMKNKDNIMYCLFYLFTSIWQLHRYLLSRVSNISLMLSAFI